MADNATQKGGRASAAYRKNVDSNTLYYVEARLLETETTFVRRIESLIRQVARQKQRLADLQAAHTEFKEQLEGQGKYALTKAKLIAYLHTQPWWTKEQDDLNKTKQG